MQLAGPQQAMALVDMRKVAERQALDYGLAEEGLIRSPQEVQAMVQMGMQAAQQAGMMPGQEGGP